MVHASYKSKEDSYEVRMITTQKNIHNDVLLVKDIIHGTSIIDYKNNMKCSIKQYLAYDIWKNNERVGFVYNKIEEDKYLGCSIYVWDHIGMILAMKTIFEVCTSHKIEFVPHKDNLKYFISMASGESIRRYHAGLQETIVIGRDDIVKKGMEIYKYMEIV